MRHRIPFFRAKRHLFMPVLLAAMLFSALVPQGFMPAFGADGFSVRLCSGTQDEMLRVSRGDPQFELIALVNGIDLDEIPSGDEADMQAPCAFAGIPHFGEPPVSADAEILLRLDAISPVRGYQSSGVYRHAQTPPATGPPFFG